jgi:hypothetical protein
MARRTRFSAAGGTSVTKQLLFDFSAASSVGGILTFNFTDDRGNVLKASFTFSWS